MRNINIEMKYRPIDFFRLRLLQIYRIEKPFTILTSIILLIGIIEIIDTGKLSFGLIFAFAFNIVFLISIYFKLRVIHKKNKSYEHTYKYIFSESGMTREIDGHNSGLLPYEIVLKSYITKNMVFLMLESKKKTGILITRRGTNDIDFNNLKDLIISSVNLPDIFHYVNCFL